jgi:hypothetical protein
LGTLGNGILVARNALGPYLGINQGVGTITGNIGASRSMAQEMAPDLH